MTTPTIPANDQQLAGEVKRRSWPDLSAYGLHFGVLDMPNGESRLVMVDTKASWSALARRMGFQQSRWLGVWVRNDLAFKIPDFKTLFPRAQVVQLTDQQIREQIKVRLLERQSMRLSQMNEAVRRAGGKRMSWHPTRIRSDKTAQAPAKPSISPQPVQAKPIAPRVTPPAPVASDKVKRLAPRRPAPQVPVQTAPFDTTLPKPSANEELLEDLADNENLDLEAVEPEEVEAPQELIIDQPKTAEDDGDLNRTVSADVAIMQTIYLGHNHLGQAVYESGDGLRFIRGDDGILSREEEPTGGPNFLRGGNESDLFLCAAGMVTEMSEGKVLRSDDFTRYLVATMGEDALEDKAAVSAFQFAVDQAMLEATSKSNGNDAAAFQSALTLHESRPSFWRQPGTLPTPLPIAVALQAMVSDHLAAPAENTSDDLMSGRRAVIDITAMPRGHSWSLPGAVSVMAGDVPAHDIAVGGIFSNQLSSSQASAALSTFGIRVTRADHHTILTSLARRADSGISAFIVAGDKRPGYIAPEMRRVLSHIGSHYEIKCLVDIDPAMVGPGSDISSRILVIGAKKPEIDQAFMVPSTSPVLYDYQSLWNLVDTVRASDSNEMSFGEDGREENRWQAPYIPTSQMTEPKAMAPRNLLGPVRKALSRIVETEGVGIDEYVAAKLGWTVAEMEDKEYLDSEQIDAMALMIYAAEKGVGFVEADAAGMGKGRTIAAQMRYYRLRNMPIVFVTEKAALFRDIYRDIQDIGSLDLFKNPLIINSGITLKDYSGEVIGESASKESLRRILQQDHIPEEFPVVLATYSQFSRKYQYIQRGGQRVLEALDQFQAGEIDRHEAISRLTFDLGISIVDAGGAATNEEALINLNKLLTELPEQSDRIWPVKHQIMIREMSPEKFIEHLDKLAPSDLTRLKQHWIRGDAIKGALLALDESHNAAGHTSTTNENVGVAVTNAQSVLYSSATFAKDIHSFNIYSRVFPSGMNTAEIGDALAKGGEPLQEILSVGLAEDGRMIRREHDNSNVEFRIAHDHARLERNEAWANSLAKVLASMSVLSGEITDQVNALNAKHMATLQQSMAQAGNAKKVTRSIGVEYTNFSSRFYTINRTFMMAIKADLAAEKAIEARQAGRKPILTVENTMESVLADMLANDLLADMNDVEESGDLPDAALAHEPGTQADPLSGLMTDPLEEALDSAAGTAQQGKSVKRKKTVNTGKYLGFKDILRKYADNIFYAWEVKYKDKKVVSKKRMNLHRPELAEAVKAVYELIEDMPDVPLSPIDAVREKIEAHGYKFEELSGRKLRVETNPDGTHSITRFTKDDRISIVDGFNDGTTDVLLLTKSGSTGISVHAGAKFLDQSQRELIEWQPISTVVGRQQSHGRHNRKDQVTPPMVTLLSSMLPGEMRLQMMQNTALRKISAMTSGNADNAAIDETVPDLLNKVGNEICLRWIENNPQTAKMMGVKLPENAEGLAIATSGTRWVDALTGRINMLEVHDQRRVYKEIDVEFKALIEQYELEGRNPLKSSQFDIKAKTVRTQLFQVSQTQDDSVFSEPVVASEIEYEVVAPGLSVEDLFNECEAGRNALYSAWGGADWVENVRDAISKEVEATAPTLLNSRHKTLETALMDESPNAAKNFVQRADTLSNELALLCPGTFLNVSTSLWERELMLITGLSIPNDKRRLCSASEYRVHMKSANTRKHVSMTVASLIHLGGKVSRELTYGSKLYDKYCHTTAERFEKEIRFKSQRTILGGNLFRASVLADNARTGQAITYSDEKGVWRHAVLMPSSMRYESVMRNLHIDINDPEMMAAMIDQNEHVTITDSDNREKATYDIGRGKKGEVWVYLHKGSDSSGWVMKSEKIVATLDGEFSGGRSLRKAKVSEGKLEDFCRAFLSEAMNRRVPVTCSGGYRPWVNDFYTNKAAEAQQAIELASQAARDQMAGVGMDDELKAMGF